MGWFSRERAEFRELLNEPSSRKPLITNRAKSRNRENCVGEKGVEYVRGLCRKHFRSKKEKKISTYFVNVKAFINAHGSKRNIDV